jgi:hypothetical protein
MARIGTPLHRQDLSNWETNPMLGAKTATVRAFSRCANQGPNRVLPDPHAMRS